MKSHQTASAEGMEEVGLGMVPPTLVTVGSTTGSMADEEATTGAVPSTTAVGPATGDKVATDIGGGGNIRTQLVTLPEPLAAGARADGSSRLR